MGKAWCSGMFSKRSGCSLDLVKAKLVLLFSVSTKCRRCPNRNCWHGFWILSTYISKSIDTQIVQDEI